MFISSSCEVSSSALPSRRAPAKRISLKGVFGSLLSSCTFASKRAEESSGGQPCSQSAMQHAAMQLGKRLDLRDFNITLHHLIPLNSTQTPRHLLSHHCGKADGEFELRVTCSFRESTCEGLRRCCTVGVQIHETLACIINF